MVTLFCSNKPTTITAIHKISSILDSSSHKKPINRDPTHITIIIILHNSRCIYSKQGRFSARRWPSSSPDQALGFLVTGHYLACRNLGIIHCASKSLTNYDSYAAWHIFCVTTGVIVWAISAFSTNWMASYLFQIMDWMHQAWSRQQVQRARPASLSFSRLMFRGTPCGLIPDWQLSCKNKLEIHWPCVLTAVSCRAYLVCKDVQGCSKSSSGVRIYCKA